MTDIHTVDVVVVGSGAAGMAAAITASIEGLSVLLVEKTDKIGGSTAVSGGSMWIPLNKVGQGVAPPDSLEQVDLYLRQLLGAQADHPTTRAFLESGPAMLDYFAHHSVLEVSPRAYSPDYYSDLPGAAMGGRTVDPLEFDGRLLGAHFSALRDPIKEFLVLGGMMVNLTDVQHLLKVTRSFVAWRAGMALVCRYLVDRLRGYHRGTRLLLGNALAGALFLAIIKRQIPYWLNSVALAPVMDGRAVRGITVMRDGQRVDVQARKGVVIATGGYSWDDALRAANFPQPQGPWSMAPRSNRGDGIAIARQAGAVFSVGQGGPGFWAPVSIMQRADGSTVNYPHLVWDRAKPGLIAVNSAGRRFVNESASYHDFVIGMRRSHETVPTIPAFLICDRRFIDRWGLGLVLPGGRPRQHLIDAQYLVEASSLRQLAVLLAIDATALEQTVERINAFANSGEDVDFGKGGSAYNRYLGDATHSPNPCLGTIEQGPFYAVKVYPGDIGTAGGIAVDATSQALDDAGQPIVGLYVVGNDMRSVMGGAYPGPGITLGPALTFGWRVGCALAQQRV